MDNHIWMYVLTVTGMTVFPGIALLCCWKRYFVANKSKRDDETILQTASAISKSYVRLNEMPLPFVQVPRQEPIFQGEFENRLDMYKKCGMNTVTAITKEDTHSLDFSLYRAIKIELENVDAGLGRLQFNIQYQYADQQLICEVTKATDLPKSFYGRLDTYVCLQILPDQQLARRTKTVCNSTNPEYNDKFIIAISPDLLQDHLLRFVLKQEKYMLIDEFQPIIGELTIRLSDFNLSQTTTISGFLQKGDKFGNYGCILLSLGYYPKKRSLTAIIKEAKDVIGYESHSHCARITLRKADGSSLAKKESRVAKHSTIGENRLKFTDTFNFNLSRDRLRDINFKIELLTKFFGVTNVVGELTLGIDTYANCKVHWEEIIAKPESMVSCWHSLREPSATYETVAPYVSDKLAKVIKIVPKMIQKVKYTKKYQNDEDTKLLRD